MIFKNKSLSNNILKFEIMSKFKNKKVLITGGASGIGKIMGRLALERGAELMIWDIDKNNLEKTQGELSGKGKIFTRIVDISSSGEVKSAALWTKEHFGNIDILINNAGIIVGKYFHEHSRDEILKTIQINLNAQMLVTGELLPDMFRKDQGHICNIASSAGLISNPKMSVYVASKWALTGWSDSLRLEMKQLGKNIGVTTVTPYYINTGMFKGVRSIIPMLKPEKAAKKIVRGIERNRIFVSMPWSIHFVRFSQGVLPVRLFDWFVGRVLGVYKTMEHFQGRRKGAE